MAHPHPHPEQLGLPSGEPEFLPKEPRDVARRRLLIGVALVSIVVIAAVALMWQAATSKSSAEEAAAAASRACRQVEGLGQKCATEPADEQAAAPQAVVPSAPESVAPLPGAPSSHGTSSPEETAAQAGMPGMETNPGDDRIVGLTVRGGRLEVSYADGSVVDAGRIEGAPPAIVLIVPSPSAVGANQVGPNGAVPLPRTEPPAEPPAEQVPSLPPGNDGPYPTGPEPTPEETYVP